jgi:hypothetical protein
MKGLSNGNPHHFAYPFLEFLGLMRRKLLIINSVAEVLGEKPACRAFQRVCSPPPKSPFSSKLGAPGAAAEATNPVLGGAGLRPDLCIRWDQLFTKVHQSKPKHPKLTQSDPASTCEVLRDGRL